MQITIPKFPRWNGSRLKTGTGVPAVAALEPAPIEAPLTAIMPAVVYEDAPPAPSLVEFTSAELRSFRSNDAMAAGMMAVILGIAFLVLLSLAIGVSVWTIGMTA